MNIKSIDVHKNYFDVRCAHKGKTIAFDLNLKYVKSYIIWYDAEEINATIDLAFSRWSEVLDFASKYDKDSFDLLSKVDDPYSMRSKGYEMHSYTLLHSFVPAQNSKKPGEMNLPDILDIPTFCPDIIYPDDAP